MSGFGPDFSEELIRRQSFRKALEKEDAKNERKNPIKQACVVATSSNNNLTGLQTIQGVIGADGDRILVKAQTDQKQNGIYIMTTSAWVRAYDTDTADSLLGALVGVLKGTFADSLFMQTTDDIVLGSSNIVFESMSGGGGGSTPTWGDIIGSLSAQTDLIAALDGKQNTITNINIPILPEDTTDAETLHSLYSSINPIGNNSRENWRYLNIQANIGDDDLGNKLGDVTGGGIEMLSASANSFNKSSVGQAKIVSSYGYFGNNVDPMFVKSFSAYSGNLQMRNNVTSDYVGILDYNLNLEPGSSIDDVRGVNITGQVADINFGLNAYSVGLNITTGNYANIFSCFNSYGDMSGGINVFSDFSVLTGTGDNGYYSFNATPELADIQNYTGLNINPTIDMTQWANGLNVDVSNITVFPGVKGNVTIQDLFFETVVSTGDLFTVAFVDDVTAGSESVTVIGLDITVHMESSVSTATQIKAAWDASGLIAANVSATITGIGSNAQTSVSSQNLTGGQYPGQKYAAQFKGDVRIDGNFSFTGSLTLGLLTSYGEKALHDNGGQPDSASTAITSLTAPNNAVIANADMIGLNTAALITIGEDATITTSFLGVAAVGLPAVVQIGTGSTIDRIAGAVFALSLQGTGTGTIDTLDLCKAIAIPNGTTVVNKLHAYNFDLPFSDVGNEIWGLYLQPDKYNWIAGSLKIGGVVDTSDKATGTNKFEMEGGDFALAADVKTGFFGKAPVVQPTSSGVATATSSYTSTEQTMLQQVYDAIRALGLMS